MQSEVDAGRIAGCLSLVARGDQIAFGRTWGYQDSEQNTPMSQDTIFRIYSMSKPITSVAVMQLLEQGRLQLDDPVSKYLPALKDVAVLTGKGREEPVQRKITVRDLLRHTSGMTYGFFGNTPVDQAYRRARVLSESTIEETVTNPGNSAAALPARHPLALQRLDGCPRAWSRSYLQSGLTNTCNCTSSNRCI